MKLKTLKDIGWNGEDEIENYYLKIKAEAIKWVKAMKGQTEFCLVCGTSHNYYDTSKCGADYSNGFIASYDYESTDIAGAIAILKHFFNLTDEDLKNE